MIECRSPDGEIVALIDAAIIALRLASRQSRDRPAAKCVKEALSDLLSDPEIALLVGEKDGIAMALLVRASNRIEVHSQQVTNDAGGPSA